MPALSAYQTVGRPVPFVPRVTRRAAERHRVQVPGRLTWRDARGATRFASVVVRDVSECGAYLDCGGTADPIPKYRLVYLQIERDGRDHALLPSALRQGRVLGAIYRVGPRDATTGTPVGYAVRFLLERDATTGPRPLAF